MSFLAQFKSDQKIIAILVIFLAVLIAGGILFWKYSQKSKDTIQESEISNWQVYQNKEYGFEIKYPSGYEVVSLGANEEQRKLERGEQISGTVPPSFGTILFTEKVNEKFKIIIHHPPSIIWTIDSQYPFSGTCGSQFADENIVNQLSIINGKEFLERQQRFGNNTIQIDYCFISGSGNLITFRSSNIPPAEVDKSSGLLLKILSTLNIIGQHVEINEKISLYLQNITGFGYGVEQISKIEEIEDIDGDGFNEFFVTASGSGGSCVGGTNYKLIYSPKNQERFVGSKSLLESLPQTGQDQSFCIIIEEGHIWEACPQEYYLDYVCFSNNLRNKGNVAFKQYLEEVLEINAPLTDNWIKYTGFLEAWFEGWDRLYYEFTYPEDKFLISASTNNGEVIIQEKESGKIHTINISYEGGRGFTPSNYWNVALKERCANCRQIENTINIKDAVGLITFINDEKEWIIFNSPMGTAWLFVAELSKPSFLIEQVLTTLSFIQPL